MQSNYSQTRQRVTEQHIIANPKKLSQKRKVKFRQRYNWNNIIVFICMLSFAVYIGDSLVRKSDRSRIETAFLEYGDVKSSIEKEMVIIRDSRVLLAPADGNYELIYPEGVRVKKGQPVAKSTSQENIEDYNELIYLIDSRISHIDNPEAISKESSDLSAINNKLETLYKNLQTRIQNDEIKYIDSIKKDIEILNDKKQLYFVDNEGTTKEKLLERKAALLKEKSSKNSTIYADSLGLVSSYCDGLESTLNIPNIKNLTVSQLRKVSNIENINYSAEIKKGEAIATIADNSHWYLACEVTKNDIDHIQSEKKVAIEIEDVAFSAVLEDFYKDKNGKFLGYFRVENDEFNFFEKRKFNAKIIYQFSKGIAIPNTAILEKDGKIGIFVVERTGIANFKPINEIAAKDTNYSAIEYNVITDRGNDTINIYDEVILNPENIKEGDRVR